MTVAARTPIVELQDINVAFGGVHAVREVTIDLYAGEVIGLVGGNGAGKSTLMRVLSGAHPADSGEIRVDGKAVSIRNPRDAKALNIETIYQTLALADNIDAPGNLFLGRERTTRLGSLDDSLPTGQRSSALPHHALTPALASNLFLRLGDDG